MLKNMDDSLKVLIVEDQHSCVTALTDLLSQSKSCIYAVDSADSISSAIDKLDKNNYDIILLDLNLPDSQKTFSLLFYFQPKRLNRHFRNYRFRFRDSKAGQNKNQ